MDLELVFQEAGRRQDPLWDVLLEVCDISTGEITRHARGGYNKAVQQLRNVRATPEDVRERAAQFKKLFPHSRLSPSQLCHKWAELRPVRREPSVIVRDGEVFLPGTGWAKL